MIALLENEFVEKKKWLEKSEFLDMVAVAESTPGPVAINSATYIGYKIAGFAGATMSTLAVSIPSFFVIYGIERNQKPLAPKITLAATHHDRQKQVEVKRSSRVNPHEIRLLSGCPYAVVK